jgi:mannose-6-phosphate isomerase-like protein (cupin superfamily)
MEEDETMSAPIVDINRFRGKFFEVLQETDRSQTAVMTIAPGRDAGPEETHESDQIVYIVEGEARVRVAAEEHDARAGACVLIPAGTAHYVKNPGARPLFFLTIYAPPAY